MQARLMDIRALGDYLGMSHETIRKKLTAGTLPLPPVTGTGRGRRWDKVEVDKWIEAQKKRREG
jgi:excisionase family DNA binding protein